MTIKSLVSLNLKTKRTKPYLDPHSTLIRSSAFGSLCPREEVIVAIEKIVREEMQPADSILNFELGHAMHERLQNEILPKLGILRGAWGCKTCGWTTDTPKGPLVQLHPYPNHSCVLPKIEYREQFFRDDLYGITGHPDGFLELPDREGFGVLEIKSIGKNGAFDVKKAPKFEHIIQAQLYLMFTNLNWSCLLYWDKSTYGVNGLIEHYVERDKDTIYVIRSTLEGIWMGIEHKVLPDRICENDKCERAKECPVSKQCFEMNLIYEGKQTNGPA